MNFYSLIFWLLFIPVSLTGQELIRDSSWLVNQSGVFFQARLQQYSNGNSVQTFTVIGDTATTSAQFQNTFKGEATRLAADANTIMSYREVVTEMIRFGRALPSVIGRSPYDSLRNAQPNLLDVSYWGINNTPIRFRVTAQGTFQYRPDTTTTWRPAAFLGDIIRLNSLQGYNTDFFRKPGTNRFISLDRRYTIKPVRQNREVDPLAGDQEEAPPAPKEPTAKLLPGGVVLLDGKKYKYNSTRKQWVQQ